jgi:hypothetical protein
MSDVAGAFKILVQAQPDQAINAFRDVLDATNKASSGVSSWTDKVLGMNQAWELGSKVMGVASSAVSSMGGAFVDLASRGGEFNELKSSFEGLAAGAGISAQGIVDSIKNISDGTVTVKESMTLANRAIVAGFSGPDIETAFKFAKKLSESGRGDFSELSNTIVDAMAKGETSVLGTFGIMAEKGESTASILKKMRDETGKFPEAAFNYQDSMTAIGKSFEDAKDYIGSAINNSESFQETIKWVQETVQSFLKSFDFSKITEWVNVAIESVKVLGQNMGIDFDSILKYMNSTWIGGAETAKAFFAKIVEGAYTIKIGMSEAFNFILSGLNTASGGFATFYNSIQYGFAEIGSYMEQTWTGAELALTKALIDMLGEVDKFQAATAGILGFEASDEITNLANEMNNVYIESAKGAKMAKKENDLFLESLGADLEKNAEKAGHVFDDMFIDTSKSKKDMENLLGQLSSISGEAAEKASGEAIAAQRKALADYKAQQKAAHEEEKKRIKEREELEKQAYKEQAQAKKDAFEFELSEEQRAFKRKQEDDFEAYKKTLEKERRYKTGEYDASTFSGDVGEEEKLLREKALKEFKRKQEDESAKYSFDEKGKKREFEKALETNKGQNRTIEIKKDSTSESVDKLIENQKEAQQKIITQEKKISIKVKPSGNRSLDQLFEYMLEYADVVAESEGSEALAG